MAVVEEVAEEEVDVCPPFVDSVSGFVVVIFVVVAGVRFEVNDDSVPKQRRQPRYHEWRVALFGSPFSNYYYYYYYYWRKKLLVVVVSPPGVVVAPEGGSGTRCGT